MKRLSLAISILFSAVAANASHILGGELRYEFTGTDYRVELALFSDCSNATPVAATQYIALSSPTCGTINLTANMYAVDTLKDMYCTSTAVSCATGSGTAYRLITRYSATVTAITPCANWKFTFNEGSRAGNIVNLLQPVNQSLYLEAFLNNSVAPNSSPVFGSDPAFITPANAYVTSAFQALDIEGDSVIGDMIEPVGMNGNPVPYSAGFTVGSSLGSSNSTVLNVPAGTLYSHGGSTGNFALAARLYDYRNGVMVGSSSRDWVTRVLPVTDYKTPLPVAGSSFLANACPGGATTMNFHFTDSLLTDSVYLTVIPQNTFTYTTVYSPGIASATATTTWTTPGTLNPAVTPYYFLKVRAYDNQCPMHSISSYTVLVRTAACTADSVWPGDANADKIVNLYDPLYVALAYGKTGASRAGATSLWMAQVCSPWALSFNTGINMKHADCDGSGTVNNTDLSSITANYGMVHLRGNDEGPQNRGTNLPDLYFNHTGITATPGGTVTIPIMLGSSAQSMSNMLGLAAKIHIGNIVPTGVAISYPTSWIGSAANTVRFTMITGNTVDWAYARNNQQNVSGQGQIGALTFTIPTGTANQKIVLSFSGVKMIDASGTEITGYNTVNDTLTIAPTGVTPLNSATFNAVVVPNPSFSNATLQLSTQAAATLQVAVIDVTGRIVWNTSSLINAGSQDIALPTTLRSGIYMLRVSDGRSVEVLKWVKAD